MDKLRIFEAEREAIELVMEFRRKALGCEPIWQKINHVITHMEKALLKELNAYFIAA